VQSGALPSGLTLNADGTVTGTPGDDPGAFEVTVRATAVNGLFADAVWTLALAASYPQEPAVTWSGVDRTIMIDLENRFKVTLLAADYAVTNDPLSKTKHIYLRHVKAGTFTMGQAYGEYHREAWATPTNVTLSQDYYIGVYEMTAYQYDVVNASNPSITADSERPAVGKAWTTLHGSAAVTAAPSAGSWMAKLTTAVAANPANAGLNLTFDLPTEAQWEYACRAGTTGTYSDSDAIATTLTECENRMDPLGWFYKNRDPNYTRMIVGLKRPNRAGLYDMHGNVWEWCRDGWDRKADLIGGTDPISPSSASNYRVVRSGSAMSTDSYFCTSGAREVNTATQAETSTGFRVGASAGN
jgi:formylglycine-generating enzyme required for sulfatase activity